MTRKRRACECGRPIGTFRPRAKGGAFFKPGPDHDLCMRCWKAETNRRRAVVQKAETCEKGASRDS